LSFERQEGNFGAADRKAATPSGVRYLAAVFGGAAVASTTFCALYLGLYVSGHLPPPPLSNNICVDEKLAFLRDNPPADPNFVVIGSSVAWRNFDSSVVEREVPGARPLNAGFCGMQVHEAAFIANWVIDRFPQVQDVLLIVSPRDYQTCRGSGRVFDAVDANKFVFERKWKWGFYLRYFDPVSLVRNIERKAHHEAEARALGFAIEFTDFGDGPADTMMDRGLFYGAMPRPDPACFEAVRSIATKLAGEDRRFTLVVTPIHPQWNARYDADGKVRRQFVQANAAALNGTGARLWDADAAGVLDAPAFTDALHLRWSAADDFTKQIVRNLYRRSRRAVTRSVSRHCSTGTQRPVTRAPVSGEMDALVDWVKPDIAR
jgi:hypothetical protein